MTRRATAVIVPPGRFVIDPLAQWTQAAELPRARRLGAAAVVTGTVGLAVAGLPLGLAAVALAHLSRAAGGGVRATAGFVLGIAALLISTVLVVCTRSVWW